jgi:hypothetical protein
MNDISAIIEKQKQELQHRLAILSENNLNSLIEERKGYEAKIQDLDAKIESICNELGIEVGEVGGGKKKVKRTRMSGAEIDRRIIEAIKAAPDGISQIDLSNSTGVSYASVVKWLSVHAETVTTQGDRKAKKIFLKA